ncbi:MAG: cytochrome c [Burkholderiaceae bacterium]|jgi:mono/diheme cytochrome c family protein
MTTDPNRARLARPWAAATLLVLVVGAAAIWYLSSPRGTSQALRSAPADPNLVRRGEYLVRAGDCASCHSARGQPGFAGGVGLATPFGTIYSSNITPDPQTGIGNWSADDLWRALHLGVGGQGEFLYPAFPYPNYTKVTRSDSDAIYAYLRSLPAAHVANRDNQLRFPYNQRRLLWFWRLLYFSPASWHDAGEHSAQWNRGAYLVEGLGHCDACHANRNLLGATETSTGLSGGQIPIMNWYAPSLLGNSEAGLKNWPRDDLKTLLSTGVSARAAIFGPMAQVVQESLQYLTPEDLDAITVFLQENSARLPDTQASEAGADGAQTGDSFRGKKLYEDHCQQCHQANGEGVPGVYPPLAHNRALVMTSAVNPIRVVLLGGFTPVTGSNQRPYGMPPFAQALSEAEIADVVSYIRNAWGNHASIVNSADVDRYRDAPLD